MPRDRTTWARAGALVSAALASMCCILPLGLGVLGLSTTAVAAFFEPLRPWFLGLTALLLAVAFYLALRAPAEGEACPSETHRLSRLSKPTLWMSALAALALALYPTVASVAGGHGAELPSATESKVVELRIDGMTCAACATGVRDALLDVPGVIDAAVSYDDGRARVRVRAERPPAASALIAAVEGAGFEATLSTR